MRKANDGPDKGGPICITCSSAENNERRRLEKLQKAAAAAADGAWTPADADTPAALPLRPKKKRLGGGGSQFGGRLHHAAAPVDATPSESVSTENAAELMQEIQRLSSADVRSGWLWLGFQDLNAKMLDCDSDEVWDAYTERMRIIAQDTLAAARGRPAVNSKNS